MSEHGWSHDHEIWFFWAWVIFTLGVPLGLLAWAIVYRVTS